MLILNPLFSVWKLMDSFQKIPPTPPLMQILVKMAFSYNWFPKTASEAIVNV